MQDSYLQGDETYGHNGTSVQPQPRVEPGLHNGESCGRTSQGVQQRVTVKQPCTWENNNNIFRVLVYFGECGGTMVFAGIAEKNAQRIISRWNSCIH